MVMRMARVTTNLGGVPARLRASYESATSAEREDGRSWYSAANTWARYQAADTGHTVRDVCGVIAALSPRLQWSRNLEAAAEVLRGERPSGVFRNSIRAAEHVLETGEWPTGPKTGAFAAAIYGDEDAVVVDAIILRALGLSAKALDRVGVYERIAAIVRREAARVGESPRDFQAIVWVATRGRSA